MGGRTWSERDDAILLALWDRLAVPAIARQLGRTPDAVRARHVVVQHGRPVERSTGRRPWTAHDDRRLAGLIGQLDPEHAAARLGRTPTAVRVRAKRLGLRWYVTALPGRPHPGYTAREVARLLGLGCSKTVTRWIERGWLQGERRALRVGPHALWRVEGDDLADFLREYRWLYDPARIQDRVWADYVARLPRADYVGVGEAARRLCYTVNGLSQLIRRGDLRAEKWGPNWRIAVADLNAFTPPPVGGAAREAADSLRAQRAALLAARQTRVNRWGRRSQPRQLAPRRGLPPAVRVRGLDTLTERQRFIIRLTWLGLTVRQIAALLGRSEQTVKNHCADIYRRLGLRGVGDPRTAAAVALWLAERRPAADQKGEAA